jgi:hypothetical protein
MSRITQPTVNREHVTNDHRKHNRGGKGAELGLRASSSHFAPVKLTEEANRRRYNWLWEHETYLRDLEYREREVRWR